MKKFYKKIEKNLRFSHYNVITIGGGTSGLSTTSKILRKKNGIKAGIIEPSLVHYYQPGWTLVGGGVFKDKSFTKKEMIDVIPKDADWIQDSVEIVHPKENTIITKQGKTITYDYLVIAAGYVIDWKGIKGLENSLGKDGVCSIYSYEQCDKTWKFISEAKGGNALFTMPAIAGGIKCGGAPQKIMYLAESFWRKENIRKEFDIQYFTGGGVIFGSPFFAQTLTRLCKEKDLKTNFFHELTEIKPEKKVAVFKTKTGDDVQEVEFKYDLLHVTPLMSPPKFIRNSNLSNSMGFVDVNKETCQHVEYSNIFSLGDCSSLPTSKTAAAISSQSPILVSNLISTMENKIPTSKYNGYTSCPLTVGDDKVVLAEFDYELKPTTSFPFIDQSKENSFFFYLKKFFFPRLYWRGLIKGLWK